MNPFAKFLTYYGVILMLLAFAWPFLPVLPIGHLPGDVVTELGSLRLYLAFGTSAVVTVLVTLILYVFQRF